MHYQCPKCHLALRSHLDEAGIDDHCPDCSHPFKVPGSAKKKKAQAILQKEAKKRAKQQSQKRQQRAEAIAKAKKSFASMTDKAKTFVEKTVNNAIRNVDDYELIKIQGKVVIGRSAEHADWLVPDPSVSRTHVGFFFQDGVLNLIDLNSRFGTVLNDRKVVPHEIYNLEDGDVIGVGPAIFEVEGQSLRVVVKGAHAHICCQDLCKDVGASDGSDKIRILNDVTLNIEPRSFVVLLGPSGSGKSTLLNALSGRSMATSGDVLLNQENLYVKFDQLKTRMATVPQKDLLHSNLSLLSALKYTADLRLPNEQSNFEKTSRVEQVIAEVEMTERASSAISTYSGGQTKRASLANELLSNPSLIFLDEATSGLDEHSDREIMAMMRQLADAGKTIVCITHNLGNVQEYVDTLVVMANGGNVAFIGSPTETLNYFSLSSLGDLYSRLRERSGLEWAKRFKNSHRGRQSQSNARKTSGANKRIQIKRESDSGLQRLKKAFQHSLVILNRTIELQLKDKRNLGVAIAQPIFVFLLIWLVFGTISEGTTLSRPEEFTNGLSILFLLGVSSFWFGCSNSAKEIVKEREIFERERDAGLSPLGYLASKIAVLFTMTMLQSWFLLVAVQIATDLGGSFFLYGLSISMTALCGVSLGLAISVLSANTDVASTAVPLAIIPQIILAGMIKPLENLPEYLAWYVAPCYWCFGSMCQAWNKHWDGIIKADDMLSQREYGLSLFVLFLFTVLFFSICSLSLSGYKIGKSTKK